MPHPAGVVFHRDRVGEEQVGIRAALGRHRAARWTQVAGNDGRPARAGHGGTAPRPTDVTAILRAAARRGIELCDLYEMQLQPEPLDPGLLVGYGNIKDTVIDGAVAALAEVIRAFG